MGLLPQLRFAAFHGGRRAVEDVEGGKEGSSQG